jgi:hypothetical protein
MEKEEETGPPSKRPRVEEPQGLQATSLAAILTPATLKRLHVLLPFLGPDECRSEEYLLRCVNAYLHAVAMKMED